MTDRNSIPMRSLQLFAEGGAGDGGTAQGTGVTATAAASQSKGVKADPLANVKYGIQPEETAPAAEVQQQTTQEQPEDRGAAFERLIKGEYKDLYDARMQDTIQRRLKGPMQTVAKYEAMAPMLEILGKKYGIDPSDAQALTKAIEEDDSYFEEEAMRRGVSVQDLRQIRKMERENADLKRMMRQQQDRENADRQYATWMKQAEEVQKIYPGFDLRKELRDPQFVNLLRNNVDARTAYEVIHKDEIIPAAMQFAAKTVEQKLANGIRANGARPSENGMSAQGAAVVKSDVSQLTRKDRAEVNRRVARGERITFG